MKQPEVPFNEKNRLKSLLSYNVLDSLPEESFDDLTKVASLICNTPISLISLIDNKRQWFKSKKGLEVNETARELAFCAHAINHPDDLFIVNNALKDTRFADNPLVTNAPDVIFYAGAPLVNQEGHALGTLCVIDNKPGSLSQEQQEALKALSRQVVSLLELRKKNQALIKKEADFKNLLRSSLAGYWDWNIHNNTNYMSPRFKSMFGYEEHEIENTPEAWQKIAYPEDLPKVFDSFEQHVASKGKVHFGNEVRFYHKDGSTVHVFCRGSVVEWAEDGSPVRVTGTHTDITQLKEQQAEIEKQVDYFKTLFSQASVGVAIGDSNSKTILKVNKKLSDMLGYSQEELISMSLKDITHPLDLKKSLILANDKTTEDSPGKIIKRYIKKSGELIWAETSVSFFKQLDIHLAIIKDITEEKLAKDESLRLTKELENRNKELEEFVYITSHDLQEPIRNINSIISLIQEDYASAINPEIKTWLDYIHGSSNRMKALINSLLDHSRIGLNKEFKSIDSQSLIDNVLSDLALSITESKAQITVNSIPRLYGDEVALRQLFQNLISNSLKYKKPNEAPIVHIECVDIDSHYHFSIMDNGIGILPKYAKKVFVIFQRLHAKDKYSGIGIGLANCKKIVALHNGKIWVESDGASGSTFHFTIKKNSPKSKKKLKENIAHKKT